MPGQSALRATQIRSGRSPRWAGWNVPTRSGFRCFSSQTTCRLTRCLRTISLASGSGRRRGKIAIDVGTRGFEPWRLLRYLEPAHYFGSKIVRTVPHETGGQTADLAGLIRRLDSKCVGICLDKVNSVGALEMPKEVVGTLGPYVLNLHIKDFLVEREPSKMGYVVRGCAAGEGRLDLPWLLAELQGYGRQPNCVLELWTPYQDSVTETVALEAAWALRSIRYRGRIA